MMSMTCNKQANGSAHAETEDFASDADSLTKLRI